MFGNTDRKFLNERQEKLQVFIDTILADPLLALSLPTKRFLDPTNYSEDFHGKPSLHQCILAQEITAFSHCGGWGCGNT